MPRKRSLLLTLLALGFVLFDLLVYGLGLLAYVLSWL
jgi:hypothetical protein